MHLERTGRNGDELVEVYETTDCRDCGKPLRAPNVSLGTAACAVHTSHRTLRCRACGTVHVDDACTASYDQDPLIGHHRGQYGPTADFGDG